MPEEVHVQGTNGTTCHGADEEGRCEDAASAPAGVREHRGSDLEEAERDEDRHRQLAGERLRERRVAATGDAFRPKPRQGEDARAPVTSPWMLGGSSEASGRIA